MEYENYRFWVHIIISVESSFPPQQTSFKNLIVPVAMNSHLVIDFPFLIYVNKNAICINQRLNN